MSELEDLGRYHQLLDELTATLARRNDALSRVAAVLGEAAKPPVSRYNLARKCRFDAADRLLNEARAAHAAAEAALAEIAVLGPIVNKPVPRME
jgi:hypothetical protein